MIVFRGSVTIPDKVFTEGFSPRHAAEGPITVTPGGQVTGGVSTATTISPALKYAAAYGGYLYVIHVAHDAEYVHVKDYMAKKSKEFFANPAWKQGLLTNAMTQDEFSIKRIERQYVIAGRKARVAGALVAGALGSLDPEALIECNPNLDSAIPDSDMEIAMFFMQDTTMQVPV